MKMSIGMRNQSIRMRNIACWQITVNLDYTLPFYRTTTTLPVRIRGLGPRLGKLFNTSVLCIDVRLNRFVMYLRYFQTIFIVAMSQDRARRTSNLWDKEGGRSVIFFRRCSVYLPNNTRLPWQDKLCTWVRRPSLPVHQYMEWYKSVSPNLGYEYYLILKDQ